MRYLSILSLTILTACSGTMTGQVRETGEKVQFNYEQGMDHDIYTAKIGNETFKGKAIMDGSSSTYANAWGEGFTNIFGTTSTNKFIAVLLGDQGHSLNCQMRYADSSGFTASGGIGICKHSDGRVIDIVW
ncbi:hypothetical protein HCZ23_10930 [Celeribacter sp. HF31]|nr:hypothetical protein [Celeribacter sp. HF31]